MSGNVGQRIRLLRRRAGMTVRRLAALAGVAPATVSLAENGKTALSVTALEKIVSALGVEFAAFFGADRPVCDGPVFRREGMRLVSDAERSYTILFPASADVAIEMFDEMLQPGRRKPVFVKNTRDVAGYVLSGSLALEIKGRRRETLRPGDAFYVPAAVEHRGFAVGAEPARLVTAFVGPARGVGARGTKH